MCEVLELNARGYKVPKPTVTRHIKELGLRSKVAQNIELTQTLNIII